MCGISGIINATRSEVDPAIVAAQIRTLDHRGPDAFGVYEQPGVALAQNRLAVIDLALGNPPISNEDGRVGVVLNGEIYNYRALRATLAADGHRLATHGDTEVIAHLAETASPTQLALQMDGMFAFAVWHEDRGRLVLGRDRLGKKPLYWAQTRRGDFTFASELKALFVHPGVSQQIDEAAIPAYLRFGYVPTPRTFFAGVQSLPPGHVLCLERGGEPHIESYWAVPRRARGRGSIDVEQGAARVRSELERAVTSRLVADVPLGAFLSGGIDSSAITAIAAQHVDHRLSTFTIGFEDQDGFDERDYARRVAAHVGTDHHEEVVSPDAVNLVEKLAWHYDQPFGDSSAIPTYLLSQMTRRHVTVALSGDGGDELFAGYQRFAGGLAVERFTRAPAPARRTLAGALNRLPEGGAGGRLSYLQRFVSNAGSGLPEAYLNWISFVSDDDRARLVAGLDGDFGTAQYRALWNETVGCDTLDRLLELNVRTYLLDDLLPKVDRMSMAHGLEVRSPFLDTDLLATAFDLPPRLKIHRLTLKRVLKIAVEDLLPAQILHRSKRGFGVPLDRWFRDDLRSYTASTLGHPRSRLRERLSGPAIDALLAEHWSGRRNLGHTLWTLLTLEVFLRQHEGASATG